MTAIVLQGDARCLPLPDRSVDLIITSPPFFGLRSYTDDGGEHYAGQIGSEATPDEWLCQMMACTREWVRVLKIGGSIFVNLGDKYSDRANAGHSARSTGHRNRRSIIPAKLNTIDAAPRKSLLGMPWRYAIACIDELSLILREDIVWSKPNGLPESVVDRARRSHEYWFHLVKHPKYFAALDEIREPHVRAWGGKPNGQKHYARPDHYNTSLIAGESRPHVAGALPGSVWTVATEPLIVPAHLPQHFAAFPTAWPKRLIQGFSPTGICICCQRPRVPVTYVEQESNGKTNSGRAKRQRLDQLGHDRGFNARGYPHTNRLTTIVGYRCACPTSECSTRPAVVLDPFGGTGTTALVASALGRTGITVDLSRDYCRTAQWRVNDPAQIAKVLELRPPTVQTHGQIDLFSPEGD